jgi:hypothetical protein
LNGVIVFVDEKDFDPRFRVGTRLDDILAALGVRHLLHLLVANGEHKRNR